MKMEEFFPPFSFFFSIILTDMPLTDDYGSITWASSKGATNNTTPQTVVSDPGTGAPAYVVETGQFTVLNLDTASVTILVKITGGTSRTVEQVTLSTGNKYINDAKYVISPGETLTLELSGTVATTQPTWTCAYYQIIN